MAKVEKIQSAQIRVGAAVGALCLFRSCVAVAFVPGIFGSAHKISIIIGLSWL